MIACTFVRVMACMNDFDADIDKTFAFNPPTYETFAFRPPTCETFAFRPPTCETFAFRPPTCETFAFNPPTCGTFAFNPPPCHTLKKSCETHKTKPSVSIAKQVVRNVKLGTCTHKCDVLNVMSLHSHTDVICLHTQM